MATDDPFADLDALDGSPNKKDQKKSERDSRKRAKMELTDTLDDLDLERKPANPYVILVALALLLGAFAFSLKPVSISMTGEGVYAVQVDIELASQGLVQNECRPNGGYTNLETASVTLTSASLNYSEEQLQKLTLEELRDLGLEFDIEIENQDKVSLIASVLKKQTEESRNVSDFSATQSLRFAEASVLETVCFFEFLFDGVLPTDGTSFEVAVQLPDRTYKKVHKLDPQMKIGPIYFKLD